MRRYDEYLLEKASSIGLPVSLYSDGQTKQLDRSVNRALFNQIKTMTAKEVPNFALNTYITLRAIRPIKIWRFHSSEESQRQKLLFHKIEPGTAFPLGRYWSPRSALVKGEDADFSSARRGMALLSKWNTMEVIASATWKPPGLCYFGMAASQQDEQGLLPGGWPQMLFEQGWLSYVDDRSFG